MQKLEVCKTNWNQPLIATVTRYMTLFSLYRKTNPVVVKLPEPYLQLDLILMYNLFAYDQQTSLQRRRCHR